MITMFNFFEKIIGPKDPERRIEEIVKKQLQVGVKTSNLVAIFRQLQVLNKKENLGFTNNFLLNRVRDLAIAKYKKDNIHFAFVGENGEHPIEMWADKFRLSMSDEDKAS